MELAAQYIDHNLLQTDNKNADDHVFLMTAAQKFGIHLSKPGNGVSHQVHLERFGVPGKTMLGADSHTTSAAGLAMLAIGAGGLDVALAMAGHPFHLPCPKIWGVKLTGKLPPWVSAKDVILEMLRRHTVKGGVGKIIEYYGPGVATLSATDRAIIGNMGAELGATTSHLPFRPPHPGVPGGPGARRRPGRSFPPIPDCTYDEYEEIDLSTVEPLIACPSSPGQRGAGRGDRGAEGGPGDRRQFRQLLLPRPDDRLPHPGRPAGRPAPLLQRQSRAAARCWRTWPPRGAS